MKTLISWIIVIVVVVLGFSILSNKNESTKKEVPAENTEISLVDTFYDLISGKWVSLDDDKYVVEIEGRNIIETYDSASMDIGTFVLADSLEGYEDKFQGGIYMIKTLGEEIYNYKILVLGESNLEIVYLDGAGGILRFKRLEE